MKIVLPLFHDVTNLHKKFGVNLKYLNKSLFYALLIK